MGCRCNDIYKLKTEIDRLRKALMDVNDALVNSSNTISNMKNAAGIIERCNKKINGIWESTNKCNQWKYI